MLSVPRQITHGATIIHINSSHQQSKSPEANAQRRRFRTPDQRRPAAAGGLGQQAALRLPERLPEKPCLVQKILTFSASLSRRLHEFQHHNAPDRSCRSVRFLCGHVGACAWVGHFLRYVRRAVPDLCAWVGVSWCIYLPFSGRLRLGSECLCVPHRRDLQMCAAEMRRSSALRRADVGMRALCQN